MAEDPKTKQPPNASAPPGDDMSDADAAAALNASMREARGEPDPKESPFTKWWQRAKAVNEFLAKPHTFKDMGREAVRGVVDAGTGFVQTISEGAAAVDRHTGLGEKLSPGFNEAYDRMGGAAKVAEQFAAPTKAHQEEVIGKRPDDALSSFVSGTTQFLTGMAAFNVGPLKGLGFAKGLVKGALTDATMFDPYQGQLAELAARTDVPGLKQLGDVLSVKGDDNAAVARFKRAAAGAIPGVTIDGLVAGVRYLKAVRTVADEGASAAEKEAAMEIAVKAKKTVDAVVTGTHVPEGSHYMVVERSDGTYSVMPRAVDVRGELPPSPRFAAQEDALQYTASLDKDVNDVLHASRQGFDENVLHDVLTGDLPKEYFLKVSPRATVEENVDLVKRLSDAIVKKRSAIEATAGGSITIEQGKQLAKETLAQIPTDQLHPTIMRLLKENPESQDIVALAADMVMGAHAQEIIKLHDILELRGYDPAVGDQLTTALNNYFALRHELRPGESAAARRLRFTQERDAVRAEAGAEGIVTKGAGEEATPAETSKNGTPKAPPEHVEAATEVREAVEKAQRAAKSRDTNAVSAADFSLARARKKVEDALAKIAKGDAEIEHDPAAAVERAKGIKEQADAQRADPLFLTPDEAAQAKGVKTRATNPIEELSKLLDQAERRLDDSLEKSLRADVEKPKPKTTPIDDLKAEVKRQAKEDPHALKDLPDAAADEPLHVEGSSEAGPLDDLLEKADGILKDLQGDREIPGESLENVAKPPRTKRIGKTAAQDQGQLRDIAGMARRDASRMVVDDANSKAVARMFKLSGGAPRDIDAVVQGTQVLQKGGFLRGALEVFTNSLLSSPPTWATVVASGQLVSVANATAKMLAGTMGGNKQLAQEGADILFGLYSYLGDNIRIARMAMREGRSIINPAPSTYAIGDMTGRVIRTPGNIMMGLDEFTRVANYRAHVRSQSLRIAREQGLTGTALAARVDADLRMAFDPETGIATIPTSLKYADVPTLSQGLQPGFGKALQNFTNDALLAKFVIPFVRASANIFDYAWQSTPLLNQFNRRSAAVFKAGGEEAATLHARSLMASTVGLFALNEAIQGRLTGKGPTDPDLRRAWMQDNKPYSIRIGDKWVSYNRMDPVATPLGLIADLHTFYNELGPQHPDAEKMTYAVLGSLVANLSSKAYMRGLFDFADSWAKGDAESVGRYLQRMGGAFAVPELLNKVNPDPYYREVDDMASAIKSRLPYFSTTVDPRFNFMGEKILRPDDILNRAITPAPTKDVTYSPVEQELLTIGKGFAPAADHIKIGRIDIDLHDRSYGEKGQPSPYVRMMELIANPGHGEPSLRKAMEREISDPSWKDLSDGTADFVGGEKFRILAGVKQEYESEAFQQVLDEYPKLAQHLEEAKEASGEAVAGGEAGQAAVELLNGPLHR